MPVSVDPSTLDPAHIRPEDEARSAVLPCELTSHYFLDKWFTFHRLDGTVLASRISLQKNGSIGGHLHPNEASWELREDGLVFLNRSGEPTTLFNKLTITVGKAVLSGEFLQGGASRSWHCLTEHIAVPPARLATEPYIASSGRADVAILVRAHRVDEKFHDLMRKLASGRSGFDVYPLIDETKGRQSVTYGNVIWHSAQACRELGLSQPKQDLLWHCGDFPLYFALRSIPDYKYYIMIEYDVDLVKDDSSFFNDICIRLKDPHFADLDVAALQFGKLGERSGWYSACVKAFPDRFCHFAYFPLIIVSKRVSAHLFAQRQLEALRNTDDTDVVHCEAFVASCAMAGGFRCADVNDLMPGCYDLPRMGMQLDHLGGLGKPIGARFPIPQGHQIVHPIYGHEEYLDRVYRKYILVGKGDWEGLARVLDSEEAAIIPDPLKANLRSQIPSTARSSGLVTSRF
jgi:hypothetical protein